MKPRTRRFAVALAAALSPLAQAQYASPMGGHWGVHWMSSYVGIWMPLLLLALFGAAVWAFSNRHR